MANFIPPRYDKDRWNRTAGIADRLAHEGFLAEQLGEQTLDPISKKPVSADWQTPYELGNAVRYSESRSRLGGGLSRGLAADLLDRLGRQADEREQARLLQKEAEALDRQKLENEAVPLADRRRFEMEDFEKKEAIRDRYGDDDRLQAAADAEANIAFKKMDDEARLEEQRGYDAGLLEEQRRLDNIEAEKKRSAKIADQREQAEIVERHRGEDAARAHEAARQSAALAERRLGLEERRTRVSELGLEARGKDDQEKKERGLAYWDRLAGLDKEASKSLPSFKNRSIWGMISGDPEEHKVLVALQTHPLLRSLEQRALVEAYYRTLGQVYVHPTHLGEPASDEPSDDDLLAAALDDEGR